MYTLLTGDFAQEWKITSTAFGIFIYLLYLCWSCWLWPGLLIRNVEFIITGVCLYNNAHIICRHYKIKIKTLLIVEQLTNNISTSAMFRHDMYIWTIITHMRRGFSKLVPLHMTCVLCSHSKVKSPFGAQICNFMEPQEAFWMYTHVSMRNITKFSNLVVWNLTCELPHKCNMFLMRR